MLLDTAEGQFRYIAASLMEFIPGPSNGTFTGESIQ